MISSACHLKEDEVEVRMKSYTVDHDVLQIG